MTLFRDNMGKKEAPLIWEEAIRGFLSRRTPLERLESIVSDVGSEPKSRVFAGFDESGSMSQEVAKQAFNEAVDLAINHELEEAGFTLPPKHNLSDEDEPDEDNGFMGLPVLDAKTAARQIAAREEAENEAIRRL